MTENRQRMNRLGYFFHKHLDNTRLFGISIASTGFLFTDVENSTKFLIGLAVGAGATYAFRIFRRENHDELVAKAAFEEGEEKLRGVSGKAHYLEALRDYARRNGARYERMLDEALSKKLNGDQWGEE